MSIIDIKQLTSHQLQAFTDNFTIPIFNRMHYHSASGNAANALGWGSLNEKLIKQVTFEQIQKFCHYPEAIPSLLNYNFKNKKVMILGSSKPWLELFLLKSGVHSIKTIEYRRIKWQLCDQLSQRWQSFTYEEFCNIDESKRVFGEVDCFISYSSLEHSGLGRYGDPIDPNGDLSSLKVVSSKISKNADILIAFPIGADSILFNRHRVYGKVRLQKICKVLGKSKVQLIKPDLSKLNPKKISNKLVQYNLQELLEEPPGTDGTQGLLQFI